MCCFFISDATEKAALITLIPTPKYKIPCDGVKNVSGVRSKCDVMSQLAPHIDNVTPMNAKTNEIIGNLVSEFFFIFVY